MDEDRVLKLNEIIYKKRLEYFNKYGEIPNTIFLNSRQLLDLELYYLHIMGKNATMIFGMNIYIDNKKVISDDDIKVLKIGE